MLQNMVLICEINDTNYWNKNDFKLRTRIFQSEPPDKTKPKTSFAHRTRPNR